MGGGGTVLDATSKAIIEQLQHDGRRPYAAIGKAVGLSEAAVRQRVQRLIESGVMQIVAVTDPLQLGFARQAMIGISVEGPLDGVADELAEMAEIDYVVVTAGSFDLLAEIVCESDEQLLEVLSTRIRTLPGCARPRRSSTCGCASRPTRGACAERVRHLHRALPRALAVARDRRRRLGAAPLVARQHRRRRRDRGGRLHRALDRLLPGLASPSLRVMVLEREVAGFGASGRNGGWCSALFPARRRASRRQPTARGPPRTPREAAVRMLRAMQDTVGEVGRVVADEGIDAHWQQGGTLTLARTGAAAAAARRGRGGPGVGPRARRPRAARRR